MSRYTESKLENENTLNELVDTIFEELNRLGAANIRTIREVVNTKIIKEKFVYSDSIIFLKALTKAAVEGKEHFFAGFFYQILSDMTSADDKLNFLMLAIEHHELEKNDRGKSKCEKLLRKLIIESARKKAVDLAQRFFAQANHSSHANPFRSTDPLGNDTTAQSTLSRKQ